MAKYYYNCKQCGKDKYTETYAEKNTCDGCGAVVIYHGYFDHAGNYFHYVPEENNHYFYNTQDGGWYWYNNEDKQWYIRWRPATTMAYSAQAGTQLIVSQPSFSGGVSGTKGSFQELKYDAKVNGRNNTDGPARTTTVKYNNQLYTLTLFSKDGGYHLIYSPTGATRMVDRAQNSKILVRIPRNDRVTPPVIGAQNGFKWQNTGAIYIPVIYNHKTLSEDGFYIVEKIPHKFNPRDDKHLYQVKRFLAKMSEERNGPDFRPDNVRFRDNGEMVLIDFSENPGVQGTDERAFAGLMKDFTQQFADCDKTYKGLYEKLRENMSSEFRGEMDNALFSWQM